MAKLDGFPRVRMKPAFDEFVRIDTPGNEPSIERPRRRSHHQVGFPMRPERFINARLVGCKHSAGGEYQRLLSTRFHSYVRHESVAHVSLKLCRHILTPPTAVSVGQTIVFCGLPPFRKGRAG